jgi:RimJ/RimL family protein N-acetyltransferase
MSVQEKTASEPSHAARRPASDECSGFYHKYIDQIPDGNLFEILEFQRVEALRFFDAVTEPQSLIIHPPYAWTIRQIVGHLIDVERIFGDRLHRFAARDPQPQPGMDQDLYVTQNDYDATSLATLVEEWNLCRRAHQLLLRRISPQAWDNRGIASDYSVTVRALAWMLAGHVAWHMKIVRSRFAGSESADGIIILEAPRLRLELQSPAAVLEWIETLPPAVRAEVSPEYIQRLRTADGPSPWTCSFAMVDRLTNQVVGSCAFKGPPDDHGMVEVAYGVEEPHQGKGYATEAAQALIGYGISEQLVQRIRAHTKSGSPASECVLQKCGFEWMGEVEDPEDGLVNRWEICLNRQLPAADS